MSGSEVLAWEAAGVRIATPRGEVWARCVPASREETGDPILVLHGFPTSSFDFRRVLPALSRERRVVLLDFPGFGLSDKPDLRYSIELHADAAEAVARALGLERVALLTHDMGNTVGGELLARDLEGALRFAVGSRVLANGSIYLGLAQLTAGQKTLLSLPDARLEPGIDGALFKAGIAATFAPGHAPDRAELDAAWELAARERGHTLLPRTIRYLEDRQAREARYTGAIERHPSPLGAVWGRRDPVAVYAMAERLREARPGTPLVTLEDAAHWPMLESPGRFAEAVLGLLAWGRPA
jgi:pimeloyl-ACP methyl ester carboxylesterase